MARAKAKEAKSADRELLRRVRERYRVMTDCDDENRRAAMDDLKFVNVPGEQWDPAVKRERGADRPMYEYNKLRITVKRIVNGIRDNRPQGKVRPVEEGDKPTAEIYEGLCRNIANVSDFDTVTDMAAEFQVSAGLGAWRVTADYCDDTAFEQELKIEAIDNPFCLYWDPAARDSMKRDAEDWILTTRISKSAYESAYGNADKVDFEAEDFDDGADWEDDETVRICEYWYKEPKTRTLCLLSNGATVDKEEIAAEGMPEGVTVVRERESRSYQIKMAICSGAAVLKRADWPGKNHPFIVAFGESMVIDGKPRWWGAVRFAKDPQRSYNVSRTAIDETIALAPQAKTWATTTQAQGHLEKWSEAHKKNYPVQLFNADPQNPGPPQRVGSADVPVALMQQAQIASEDIKAVTGIFDPSLGNRSNEQSGIAIRARQAQGEIATFNYQDNIAKAVRRTWEILIDLVPFYYDTQRNLRLLGADGSEKYVTINQQTPTGDTLNDLSRGRFDVVVTTGPSFATRRQEAAEAYSQLAAQDETLMMTAGDLVYKAMDLPYSEEIAERKRMMLPPQIQQQISSDKPMPPEVQAAMAQVQAMQAQVQEQGQLVQAAAAEAEQEKGAAEKAKSEVAVASANLKVQEADLARQVAEFEKLVAETEANMAREQSATKEANADESAALKVQAALAEIQQAVAQYMQQATDALGNVHARMAPQIVVANPPKRRQVRVRRINGELVGDVVEIPDDQPQVQ
jgi:hypothetical protein